MREYKDIYEFRVLDEIKAGAKVYCIDKYNREITSVEGLHLDEFFYLLDKAEQEAGRFEFYKIVESEDEE